MKVTLQDLSFCLVSGAGAHRENLHYYNEAYKLWKSVWFQTLNEHDGISEIHSDDFTRQTQFGCIFWKDTCVAQVAIRECDLKLKAIRDDSILKAWDDDLIEKAFTNGPTASIASNLCVHPEFRGEVEQGLSLKQLSFYFLSKMFLELQHDGMIATTRVNRGANRTAYNAGAVFLKRSILHKVDADLVVFLRPQVIDALNSNRHLWVDRLWDRKKDLRLNVPRQNKNLNWKAEKAL